MHPERRDGGPSIFVGSAEGYYFQGAFQLGAGALVLANLGIGNDKVLMGNFAMNIFATIEVLALPSTALWVL